MAPPKFSFLDSTGHRFVTLAIDVMTEYGDRFYASFRCIVPVNFNFNTGNWSVIANEQSIMQQVLERYPTLSRRKDIQLCLEDAKQVPRQPSLAASHHNNQPSLAASRITTQPSSAINHHHYAKN